MTIATPRRRPRALALALAALLAGGCASGGSRSATGSPAASGVPGPSGSASGSPLAQAELKYRIIDALGHIAFCDPDAFPVRRDDEGELARQHLAEIRADTATFAAIAAHLGVDPAAANYTADQQLAIYAAWKELRVLQLDRDGDRYRFDVVIGPDPTRAYMHIVGTITSAGAIEVQQRAPGVPPACPICLARGTPIDTPDGAVAVEALRPGMAVWTADRAGRRLPGVVLRVGSAAAPPTHRVVNLALADGRSLTVSPGHPLPDGRRLGDLRPGDTLDGSVVVRADLLPYDQPSTFDLLPSGGTGFYWAGGILVASTLH
jgi:Hint domain